LSPPLFPHIIFAAAFSIHATPTFSLPFLLRRDYHAVFPQLSRQLLMPAISMLLLSAEMLPRPMVRRQTLIR
jgi:hypothetical protein